MTVRWLLAIVPLVLAPAQALAAAHIITVTATYLRQDGVTPATGRVTYQLSATLRDSTTGKTYSSEPQTVTLDLTGHISMNLVANDDPEVNPTGTTYAFTQIIDGVTQVDNLVVPYSAPGGTIDLAALVPSSSQLVYSVSQIDYPTFVLSSTRHQLGIGNDPAVTLPPVSTKLYLQTPGIVTGVNQNMGPLGMDSETTRTTGPFYGSYFFAQANPAGASTALVRAVYGDAATKLGSVQDFSGATFYGVQGQFDHTGTGNVVGSGSGVSGIAQTSTGGTGTLTNGYGVRGRVENNAAASTVTNAYAVYAANGTINAGPTTNRVGLTAEEQTAATNNTDVLIGTATPPAGNWAIYSPTTRSSLFSGLLTLQPSLTTTPGLVLDSTLQNRDTLAIKRWNNTNGVGWDYGGIFNSQGAYYTNAWILASGVISGSPDATGIYLPVQPDPNVPNMIGCYADVLGPCITSRPANGAGVSNYAAMDHAGNYIVRIPDSARVEFGSGTTYASAWDAEIDRTSSTALHTNASWTSDSYLKPQAIISTSPTIATACSSSTAGAMVYVDKSNDTAVSHMCFCGTAADDVTYGWRRVDAPGTTCP